MDGRIGDLHVRYRTPRGSLAPAAAAPGLDRAIAAGLGEAIAERLDRALPPDGAVIVVRELNSRVVLGPSDWSLDRRAVDRISRASCATLADVLHGDPPPDLVMRFDDEAEFIGSFFVDLLRGSAWDQWYYGAFRPYRSSDPREVLLAVLADRGRHAARVFAWLARRGMLDAVLALIGTAEARRAVTGRGPSVEGLAGSSDLAPLVEAAMMLLDALGWRGSPPAVRQSAIQRYLATSPMVPSWTDRRSLSSWVLACAQSVAAALLESGVPRGAGDSVAIRGLLHGQLDWLDGDWLEEPLLAIGERAAGPLSLNMVRPSHVLAASHEHLLERLAEVVRERRIRFPRAMDRDGLVVALIAGLAELSGAGTPIDRAIVAAVERIAAAWDAARGSALEPLSLRALLSGSQTGRRECQDGALARQVDQLRAISPAALAVLRETVEATINPGTQAAHATPFGGLYILTRGVLDVRLRALALEASVPFDLLLAALAHEWFGAAPPYDLPTMTWIGTDRCDLRELADFEAPLDQVRQALVQVLLDQHSLDAPPLAALTPAPAAGIAWLVMRAWSRWLPGLASASPSFLLDNCLARGARVAAGDTSIDVSLDPAPLDVVLEMAGYLRPIEAVPWLNGRTMTFSVRRVG